MINITENRSTGNSYYERKKEQLQDQARNHYYQNGVKEKAKEYYENIKGRIQKQYQYKNRGLSNEKRI